MQDLYNHYAGFFTICHSCKEESHEQNKSSVASFCSLARKYQGCQGCYNDSLAKVTIPKMFKQKNKMKAQAHTLFGRSTLVSVIFNGRQYNEQAVTEVDSILSKTAIRLSNYGLLRFNKSKKYPYADTTDWEN